MTKRVEKEQLERWKKHNDALARVSGRRQKGNGQRGYHRGADASGTTRSGGALLGHLRRHTDGLDRHRRALELARTLDEVLREDGGGGSVTRPWQNPRTRKAHLVDVGEDTTASNGGADERVELLVTADSELQVTGGDTLDAKVLRRVACGSAGRSERWTLIKPDCASETHLQAREPRR